MLSPKPTYLLTSNRPQEAGLVYELQCLFVSVCVFVTLPAYGEYSNPRWLNQNVLGKL